MTTKTQSTFDLNKHLADEHKMTPLTVYLKEIVYGGNDGIITTFAVVAGFAGASANIAGQLPVLTVLLFGFANLFADGVSMSLGNFLSSKSEKDVYSTEKNKESFEIIHNTEMEKQESIEILINRGFSRKQAEDLIAIYMTNDAYWVDFMMSQELELPNPEGDNPYLMALATFFSFLIFGFIPLIPYVFFTGPTLFLMSSCATAAALGLLGSLRWKVGKQGFLRSVGETLFLGGTAAIVAYFVGTMFKI
jgi:VIT1/CCC1 family predicted Fe2+/Mn2+ transporter